MYLCTVYSTTADIGQFGNKLYKVKKNSINKLNKNIIYSNKNIEKIKDKNKETKAINKSQKPNSKIYKNNKK